MPQLTLDIPHSAWSKLEKVADREGLKSVRQLCIWRIRDIVAEADSESDPEITPEPAAA